MVSEHRPTLILTSMLAPAAPVPPHDPEALAAYLYMHCDSARQRAAALDHQLQSEEEAEAMAKAEMEVLRAELQQCA